MKARDLFAGSGWGIACRNLGIEEHGVEWNEAARETRRINGLITAGSDVRDVNGADGGYLLEIGSPPCERFTSSGHGDGHRARAEIVEAVLSMQEPGDIYTVIKALGVHHEKVALVLEPLRVLLENGCAQAAVWEQVREVLPIWQAIAVKLRDWGWSVDVQVVNASWYGVPQDRKRAILLARRNGEVVIPGPIDPPRVMSDVFPGRAGWVQRSNNSGGSSHQRRTVEEKAVRTMRRMDQPSVTMTSKGFKWVLPDGSMKTATVADMAVIQTFPEGMTFAGGIQDQRLQVGNAVPPLMAEALIRAALGLTPNSQGCKVTPEGGQAAYQGKDKTMAIYKTRTALKIYPLSNGTTVDLIKLIDTDLPAGWVAPTRAPEIGTVAYVSAMGAMRRGVVVKTTKTKVHVAVTTQGALDTAMRFGWTQPVRVQIAIADINHVRVAPPAEPVVEVAEIEALHEEALREDETRKDEQRWTLSGDIIDAHAEAIREDWARGRVAAVGESWSTHMTKFDGTVLPRGLTPNSQDGKVDNMDNDAAQNLVEETEPEFDDHYGQDEDDEVAPAAEVREATGSAVVKLLERVHERIRQNHPDVPAVVMVTGAGTELGNSKWGHFRPQGWTTSDKVSLHEMFMAGETLAKGAEQVLQTMLHESAHALAAVRKIQDTSRQNRWHNKEFLKLAEEMGLKHSRDKADKAHGYSFMVLTEDTRAKYADLLAELNREIHLMVRLPVWLGGDAGEGGGEGMGRKPRTTEGSSSSNLKLTCACPEPNIIRASKKVADKCIVRCDDCDARFMDRG